MSEHEKFLAYVTERAVRFLDEVTDHEHPNLEDATADALLSAFAKLLMLPKHGKIHNLEESIDMPVITLTNHEFDVINDCLESAIEQGLHTPTRDRAYDAFLESCRKVLESIHDQASKQS